MLKRTLLAALFSGLMTLGVVGCGGEGTTPATDTTTAPPADATTPPADAGADAPADTTTP